MRYYQPQVNLRTEAAIGAEALIRWQHPKRGLLLPQEFLPAIEDDLLAVELGEWVIETALTQMDSWRASGLDLPVSVNVGARQLRQADFVARLRALLAAHPGVKPSSLELEILENSAMQDLAQVARIFADCRALGVGCALDDFGIGYSSLSWENKRRLKTPLRSATSAESMAAQARVAAVASSAPIDSSWPLCEASHSDPYVKF